MRKTTGNGGEQSLPLGGKVPSESEANEGRDMLSQEGKDGEPREDLTSSVNSVDSSPLFANAKEGSLYFYSAFRIHNSEFNCLLLFCEML